MRIAFVSTIRCYPWGGADAVWTKAAEAALARGDDLLVAVTPRVAAHPRVHALIAGGAKWQARPVGDALPRLYARLLARAASRVGARSPLVRALEKFSPELIITSCGGTYDLVAEPALTDWLGRAGVPFRVVANWQAEHPVLDEGQRKTIVAAFARATAIHFLSHRNLEITRAHLLEPLSNATVLQTPLRDRPVPAPAWPDELVWSLATLSRLEPEKGIPLLLEAVARVLPAGGGWALNIYGRGPQEKYLQAAAASFGLSARVHLRGFVESLADVWSGNHILVSPAIDEGVPMTIPESMFCARPALATCVGGAEEWITPGRNGFLCLAPTRPLLAAALDDAWSQRARWREFGAAAATDAQARYKPNDYLRLINCPRRARHGNPR